MKTHIFYFSSTGNSLIVAKDIATNLSETKIFPIPKVMNQEIDLNADNIGIVFPVYYMGLPRIVIDFLNNLESSKIKYCFAICTSASGLPGGTLLQAQKLLQSKGITLQAGFSIRLPGNYLVKYGAYSDKKQNSMFLKEKEKIQLIVQVIKNQQKSKIEQNNLVINKIGKLVYDSKYAQFPTLDKNFKVTDKCNYCQTCEKVCPVQNIKMIDKKPTWQGNCEHCLACIQWCPMEAIQYDNKTSNRKRYHHPEVKAVELYRE